MGEYALSDAGVRARRGGAPSRTETITRGKIQPAKPVQPAEPAKTTTAAAVPAPGRPAATPAPEKPAPEKTASAAPAVSPDTLRFDQPVPFGAYPVRGSTLEELAGGEPLFSPIEGLEDELWKKPCSTCHKWNKERLCEQGSSYIKAAKYVLRHQHPYGGPYKLALMRWAKSGCN